MDLRLLKVRLPDESLDSLEETLDDEGLEVWYEYPSEHHVVGNVLLDSADTEEVVGALEERFGRMETFRLVLLPVESTVPMPREDEEESDEAEAGDAGDENGEENGPPINVEELYTDITDGIELSWTYVAVAALSSVVATVGILRNDVAVVIAAMIIAPLLSPNMSLSLATTLADAELAVRSLKVNVLGLGVALVVAFVFGGIFPVDPESSQIVLRTRVGVPELLLAASAGAAGALSFTTGAAGRVTGVMIAVALLPPVVIAGMLGGAGRWGQALGALYLVASNVICVNLAGVVTFFVQRIRPRRAWEAERAASAFWWALAIWITLLTTLFGLIVASGAYRGV